MSPHSFSWSPIVVFVALVLSLVRASSPIRSPELTELKYDALHYIQSEYSSIWTQQPLCSSNSWSSEEYCAFTSTPFANGRGISLVTFPRHAEHLIKLPAFKEASLHRILGLNQQTNPPFVLTEFKDRGIGLVANRTILRGEWLMSFTPAYMAPSDIAKDLDNGERLQLLHHAFQQLPTQIRNSAENLAVQGEEEDIFDDIMRINSFIFPIVIDDEGNETQYSFLFPEIARLNHDCRPNAHYSLDHLTLTLHVIAFRDIFAGEELTITYIDPIQKRKARLRALNQSWGFQCHCSLCTAPSSAESDARIDKIIELSEQMEDPHAAPGMTSSPPMLAEQVISLYKQENLWTSMHNPYGVAALHYNGVGNVRKVKESAEKALQSGFLCRGTLGTEYSYLQELISNPQNHQSWMQFINNLP